MQKSFMRNAVPLKRNSQKRIFSDKMENKISINVQALIEL